MEVERGLPAGIAERAGPGLGPGMAAEPGPAGLGLVVESGTCCVRGCGAAAEAGRAALG